MSKLQYLIRSRKFWAAVIALVMMFVVELVPNFPFDTAQVEQFVWVVVSYILGVAIEDAGRAIASK